MSEAETVKIDDLVKTDFPTVNENAVSAVQASEKPQISTYEVGAGKSFERQEAEKSGYNPEIHEYPPRKNKHGEWARKRGNKKGFPAKRNAKTETANAGAEPPPLNIPKHETDIAAEKAEAEKAAELERITAEQTRAAAEMVANTVFLGANAFSGYKPEAAFHAAYVDAWERYLNTFGGVNLPPWVEVALMSGTIVVNAARQEKAKPKIQKIKEWFAGKIYAFRNRKNRKVDETGSN